MLKISEEQEKKEILRKYRGLLRAASRSREKKDKQLIRKAFDVALEAHKDVRRKSGELYIFHPLAVARIAAEEIGLGTISIVCALLHDTVEDTQITLKDIEKLFGKSVAKVIDGLTKIADVVDHTSSMQAENFRKVLLTLSDDVRVILIKLSDRLHNMRTLDSVPRQKQMKIASETQYLYAPLAHRLGLYPLKSELEDLSLKYLHPEIYEEITQKLKKTQPVRTRFINRFSLPIKRELEKEGFEFEIKSRTKSIYSIWNKIQTKNIPFEEIYDVFALRIILHSSQESEKADCWKVYSVITDFYKPNPDRLRDWISTPKANGYESLHTTVMSPGGKWVEVQIRSKRMDEIAEKGYASHWKYKESKDIESSIDQWLSKIRDLLENPEQDAIDFLQDFKLNLFSDEIFVFTPTGELKTLPKGATALDFAFEIHTQVGAHCVGAKVNQKLSPLSEKLKSGDQIEIITSKKINAKEDWIQYVVTAKAKSAIKSALKEELKKNVADGKEQLRRKLAASKLDFSSENIAALQEFFQAESTTDLYNKIFQKKIDLKKIKSLASSKGKIVPAKAAQSAIKEKQKQQLITNHRGKIDMLTLGDEQTDIDYTLARCCNPIPGDEVFGFVTINDGIKIHRNSCPNAVQLLSNYAYRVIKARWRSKEAIEFLAGIKFTGIDDVGLVNRITNTISKELNINMRSISFESDAGIFEGRIILYIFDKDALNGLIRKLKSVEGVLTVGRIDAENFE